MSVLADRDEWVYRDYEKVTRAYVARRSKVESKLVEELRRELVAAQSRRDRRRAAARPGHRRRHAPTRDRLIEEISRRASFRWWLALPLRRLVRALKGLPPGG